MAEHGLAVEIAEGVRGGCLSAAAVCREALDRAGAVQESLNAFREVWGERALERAAELDRRIGAGEDVGVLAGVPVALKDNLCTTQGRTTAGSRMLADFRSPYNATVVQRIERAGGVIIGKTNMDEFGMGSSTEASAFGATRNPWNVEYVPGGSSGGSAAAVAAGIVPVALGSDTGGSIRQPAAFCGVTGLKPTYGRVSRYGLVAYGSSFDQVGPLGGTVEDVALLLGVIAGHDPLDGTSAEVEVADYVGELAGAAPEKRALRIGFSPAYLEEGLDVESRVAIEAALDLYRSLGVEVVEVTLPKTPEAIAAYYLLVTAECSSNLARYDGVHYGYRAEGVEDVDEVYVASRSMGFGDEVKRRIMLGTFALSAGYHDAYYEKALKVRRLVRDEIMSALQICDVIVAPVAPTAGFRVGEKMDDPLAMFLADVYTIGASLAGLPALAIPCGITVAGLPIGLQLIGPAFGEWVLLGAAQRYQRETDWHERRPPMAAS